MLQRLQHLREIIFKLCSEKTKQVKKENFRRVCRVSISYALFISGNYERMLTERKIKVLKNRGIRKETKEFPCMVK